MSLERHSASSGRCRQLLQRRRARLCLSSKLSDRVEHPLLGSARPLLHARRRLVGDVARVIRGGTRGRRGSRGVRIGGRGGSRGVRGRSRSRGGRGRGSRGCRGSRGVRACARRGEHKGLARLGVFCGLRTAFRSQKPVKQFARHVHFFRKRISCSAAFDVGVRGEVVLDGFFLLGTKSLRNRRLAAAAPTATPSITATPRTVPQRKKN